MTPAPERPDWRTLTCPDCDWSMQTQSPYNLAIHHGATTHRMEAAPVTDAGLREAALAEFDGSLCPACHHRSHDPGSCHEGCDRCELHTDEALAFVLRYEPELIAALAVAPVTDARLDPYRDLNEHIRQERNGTHAFDEGCYFCRADAALSRQAEKETA